MKKLILIGITVGFASLTQATTVTNTVFSGGVNSMEGTYAYDIQVTAASLGLSAGQTISGVSLNFNGIKLTSTGSFPDQMNAALINANNTTFKYTDNDGSGNYFTGAGPNLFTLANPGVKVDAIGQKTTIYNTSLTWSWNILDSSPVNGNVTEAANTLTDLNNDLTGSLHGFDLGIDPDCYYNVGSITLTYTIVPPTPQPTPDTATTAGLLGASLLGLLAFRRKLALQ